MSHRYVTHERLPGTDPVLLLAVTVAVDAMTHY